MQLQRLFQFIMPPPPPLSLQFKSSAQLLFLHKMIAFFLVRLLHPEYTRYQNVWHGSKSVVTFGLIWIGPWINSID